MVYFQPVLTKSLLFLHHLKMGRVHELLINSKKASTSPVFEENVERFLCLRFSITHIHFISASMGLPAVWWFKISKKTSSIFSSVSIIFFLPPTSFSDPFFWYICTISDLINSSHDSLEMASKHATYIGLTHLKYKIKCNRRRGQICILDS